MNFLYRNKQYLNAGFILFGVVFAATIAIGSDPETGLGTHHGMKTLVLSGSWFSAILCLYLSTIAGVVAGEHKGISNFRKFLNIFIATLFLLVALFLTVVMVVKNA